MTADVHLIEKFTSRNALIGVIGMGYVGLPLALTFASQGFRALGLDIDETKVDKLMGGESYIRHLPAEATTKLINSGHFIPTGDFARLAEVDAIIICVPTPLGDNRDPDLSYVESTARSIAPHLQKDQLVVLESTTYPGSCETVLKPILESGGLKSGTDFYLAYSPEREDPGNPDHATAVIPKVVGGDGIAARELACAMYDEIVVQTVPVSSMDVAEAVKLTENIFRSVNIALVNELKTVYAKMGVDIWEVIEAAKTKPFGYMPFYPGPGLGGHCIPIDPFYLTWRAKQVGEKTRFIELAGEINTAMPGKVVDKLEEALRAETGKSLKDVRILLAGLAYKKNVNDTRESPALVLIELLEERGAAVEYHDPYVPEIPPTREHAALAGRQSVGWTAEVIEACDAVLICTDHDDVDYGLLAGHARLIVDTRNAMTRVAGNQERIVKV
jgi:UDP-N-acetyl-D-glucosamine dehydrogenase